MSDFSDLETLDDLKIKKPETKKDDVGTFPCQSCGGSGVWRGGVNRHGDKKCFTCNGRGFFKTSHADRIKAKKQRAARKAKKNFENAELFKEMNPVEYEFLLKNATWSDFYKSLFDNVEKYGDLTEKQMNCVREGIAREEEKERKKEEQTTTGIDLKVVHEKFNKARENKIKRPVMRLEKIKLSRAPDNGVNAGHIYVKDIDTSAYYGKVTPEGTFKPVYNGPEWVGPYLLDVAQDVLKAARTYGLKTGVCSCCGRELTKNESIEAGIGPICAGKWGL